MSQPIKIPGMQIPGVDVPDFDFKLGIDNLPEGSTITVRRKADGKWPARPTTREDIHCVWKGKDPDPKVVKTGTGGMLDEVDTRFVTP